MDPNQNNKCQDFFNPLNATGVQMAIMLVIGHVFHLVLKPLGQSGPIAQILAGLALGRSGLSQIPKIRKSFFESSSADFNGALLVIFRTFFMFQIGLEMDIRFLLHNIRAARAIAYSGILVCSIFGAAISLIMINHLEINGSRFLFSLFMMLTISNTASPVVIQMAAEMKFATSDLGRLAISSSLLTEITCLLVYDIFSVFHRRGMVGKGVVALILTFGVILLNKYLATWLNARNRSNKYLNNAEVLLILFIVMTTAALIESLSYNSTVCCFLLGLLFPREGKAARTLMRKLTVAVHDFMLSLFFSYTGFQCDVAFLKDLSNVIFVFLMVLLSFGGKIIGTLAACHYLEIPLSEGVVLAFFLNLKGHAELSLFTLVQKHISLSSVRVHGLILLYVVIDTLISGIMVSHLQRKEENLMFTQKPTALEMMRESEKELRLLACVFGPQHVPATAALIYALKGSQSSILTPYMMHLVELPNKPQKTNLSYHELEDEHGLSDEEDYGGNDVLEISNAADSFTKETRILIHQSKVVSSMGSFSEDVCTSAEDLCTSIIFLPFHKHQRIDGTMVNSRDGIRTINQKVLRDAPCSVGILVDRGLEKILPKLGSLEVAQHVAVLFFGGPDDREALACGIRIARHPHVYLTVIRFLPPLSDQDHYGCDGGDRELLMAMSSNNTEKRRDNAFLSDLYERYATSGQVGYLEKNVSSGAETTAALRDMADTYCLYIVGKGGRPHSPMATGLSDWEECPELGTVGDLLASSDFNISGSVLVIQQDRHLQAGISNMISVE